MLFRSRVPDEFVRHKLLDCIGDLGLLGAPLVGRVSLVKPGHTLHARFMTELMARKEELLTVVEMLPLGHSRQDRRLAASSLVLEQDLVVVPG